MQCPGPRHLYDDRALTVVNGFEDVKLMRDAGKIDIGGEVHVRPARHERDRVQCQNKRIASPESGHLSAERRADIAGQAVAG